MNVKDNILCKATLSDEIRKFHLSMCHFPIVSFSNVQPTLNVNTLSVNTFDHTEVQFIRIVLIRDSIDIFKYGEGEEEVVCFNNVQHTRNNNVILNVAKSLAKVRLLRKLKKVSSSIVSKQFNKYKLLKCKIYETKMKWVIYDTWNKQVYICFRIYFET